MNFLNETVADILQYVSFFLEAFGLSLAFIEIKFPKRADKIEKGISRLELAVRGLGQRMTNNNYFEVLITIFIFMLFVAVLPSLWGLFELPIFAWVIFDIVGVVVGLTIGLHILVDFIEALNNFSNGRALGALGIFISGIGVIAETYQIVYIWYY